MRLKRASPLLVVVMLLSACQASPEAQELALKQYLSSADSVSTSSAPGIADLSGNERKVIREADIKCRVSNVLDAVADLERFTVAAAGFVQLSHTENNILNEKTAVHKDDSLKTAQVYRTTANMVIRVPVYALDTLANHISGLAIFVHHRDVSRKDVTLQFIANALKNREAEKTIAIAKDIKQVKTPEAFTELQKQTDQNVDRRITNLGLVDNSRYATLSLEIYQPEQVLLTITQNTDKLVAQGLGERLYQALATSTEVIIAIALALVSLWPVWAIVMFVLLWYRRSVRRSKAAANVLQMRSEIV